LSDGFDKFIYMKKSVFYLIFILFFSSACEKSGFEKSHLYASYKIVKVESDRPIDLNFDGQANTDLNLEIDGWEDAGLHFDRSNGYASIIWMEPQFNDGPLYEPLPIEYNGKDDI